jgi:hypothetical protein
MDTGTKRLRVDRQGRKRSTDPPRDQAPDFHSLPNSALMTPMSDSDRITSPRSPLLNVLDWPPASRANLEPASVPQKRRTSPPSQIPAPLVDAPPSGAATLEFASLLGAAGGFIDRTPEGGGIATTPGLAEGTFTDPGRANEGAAWKLISIGGT